MTIQVRWRKPMIVAMLVIFVITAILAVLNYRLIRRYGTATGYLVLGGIIFAGAAVCAALALVYMLMFSFAVEGEQVTYRKWFRKKRTTLQKIRDARIIEKTRRTEYIPNSLFFRGGGECIQLFMEKDVVRVREEMENYQELKSLLASRGILEK